MLKFVNRLSAGLFILILALALIALGTALGQSQDPKEVRSFWFDSFMLLGTWLSGFGAVLAAIVALHIAGQQRQEAFIRDSVRTLHHMMAVVKDTEGRLVYLRKTLFEGGRPLAAATLNCTAVLRRYESFYDRELYTTLPGVIVDQITDMSGSFAGIEMVVTALASQHGNEAHKMLPPNSLQPGAQNAFDQLQNQLDNLYSTLESERKKLEAS